MNSSQVLQVLGQPITLKLSGKIIPNRLYRSALSEYLGTFDSDNIEANGKPLPEYANFHKALADGDVGLICFGNIPVHRDYLQGPKNVILDASQVWEPVQALAPAIEAAKSKGGICLPQITFPGRQIPEHLNSTPLSSSDVQLSPCLGMTYGKPTPLSREGIQDLVKRFAWAAKTLADAGADGAVIHASHGYIFTQFLSPTVNRRTDEYGGSLENRARFLLETVHAIQKEVSTDRFVIGVKFNCHDFIEGGQTFEDECIVFKWLEDAGVDFFDITGGTYASPAWRGEPLSTYADFPSGPPGEGVFLRWAKEFKKISTRAIIGTTGGWRDRHYMERAIRMGEIDMCGFGRPLQENANFIKDLLLNKERKQERTW
ncbi:uncharacterized protein BJX67DRAFT_377876 [Aspergillus lucknowensis]|uniref:NADH:flavin oxidoreductase/NADH oxidase N-terminal domain-containing protein n=1 Tax=Aspergillus lucknowensis TaxID=176173 RepID=A0ABR4M3U3_9EURO